MQKYFDINESGRSIRCKLYFSDRKIIQKVILFGHGFGGHKDNRAAEHFADRVLSKYKGYALITFDWPCHGSDARKNISLEECDLYLGLVLDYIRESLGTEDICGYGTSFGGYLFLKYIHDHGNPFRKAAFRSLAVNIYESLTGIIMSEEERDKAFAGKPVLVGFDRKVRITKAFLDELKEADIRKYDYLDYADDLLLIHGTSDEIIPYEEAEQFAENNVIELVAVEGADHRFLNPLKMDIATQAILDFYH